MSISLQLSRRRWGFNQAGDLALGQTQLPQANAMYTVGGALSSHASHLTPAISLRANAVPRAGSHWHGKRRPSDIGVLAKGLAHTPCLCRGGGGGR